MLEEFLPPRVSARISFLAIIQYWNYRRYTIKIYYCSQIMEFSSCWVIYRSRINYLPKVPGSQHKIWKGERFLFSGGFLIRTALDETGELNSLLFNWVLWGGSQGKKHRFARCHRSRLHLESIRKIRDDGEDIRGGF